MPPLKHAKLSPSASERWISCPASVRMERAVAGEPEIESPYATEGSAAHEMGEIKAGLAFSILTLDEYHTRLAEWRSNWPIQASNEDVFAEMWDHTDGYVQFLQERVSLRPGSQILLEQRLDTGVPTSWGTSDAVIVSTSHVEIVDLKYGMGVAVNAADNPQLRLYGLGALDAFDGLLGDPETVTVTVYQPRLGSVSSETMLAADIRGWRETIIPIAVSALGPDAPFGPSADACRWCKVSGRCRAQLEKLSETDFADDPELLGPAEIAEQLERAPLVKQWLLALEKQALTLAYGEGLSIPGWKVVASGGRRTIPDQEGAILHLQEYCLPTGDALDVDQFATLKLKGLGELEKLFGGVDGFNQALGDYVVKTEGTPSLVRETDRRKAISPNTEAQKDFLIWKESEE